MNQYTMMNSVDIPLLREVPRGAGCWLHRPPLQPQQLRGLCLGGWRQLARPRPDAGENQFSHGKTRGKLENHGEKPGENGGFSWDLMGFDGI